MRFEQIICEMESIVSDLSQWFMNNNPKANAGKFHLFLSPYDDQTITVKIFLSNQVPLNSSEYNSNFEEHIPSSYQEGKITNFMPCLIFLNI